MPDDSHSGYASLMNAMRHPQPSPPSPPSPSPTTRRYDLTMRDFVGDFRIGVWDHEKTAPQRLRINLTVTVEVPARPFVDELDAVVSYEYLIDGVRALARSDHIQLLEVLAERLVELCLSQPQAVSARVQVEKLDIVPESAGVGILLTASRDPRG